MTLATLQKLHTFLKRPLEQLSPRPFQATPFRSRAPSPYSKRPAPALSISPIPNALFPFQAPFLVVCSTRPPLYPERSIPIPAPISQGARSIPRAQGARSTPTSQGARSIPTSQGARSIPTSQGARSIPTSQGARSIPRALPIACPERSFRRLSGTPFPV